MAGTLSCEEAQGQSKLNVKLVISINVCHTVCSQRLKHGTEVRVQGVHMVITPCDMTGDAGSRSEDATTLQQPTSISLICISQPEQPQTSDSQPVVIFLTG